MRVPRPMRALDESASGRIMGLLRRGSMTVDDLAAGLELSGNAIRAQLALLERDGLVRRTGQRPGTSKPARLYALTLEAELLFSHAYILVLTELLHVLSERVGAAEFDAVMRDVGRRLMADRPRPTGNLRQRAEAASELLNALGGLARVEDHEGSLMIRGDGCPLAAATRRHPEA